MNMGELWKELAIAWLESIGCEMILKNQPPFYFYEHVRYRLFVTQYWMDIGQADGYYVRGKNWANVDLDLKNADPRDPSFDPCKFFAPFKVHMDAKKPNKIPTLERSNHEK